MHSLGSAKVGIRNGMVRILEMPKGLRFAGTIFHDQRTGKNTLVRPPVEGLDPTVLGFDLKAYQGASSIQISSALAYVASATVQMANGLPKNTLITEILLVADPFDTQGDGTNTATIVEDAMDKLLQGLNIVGGIATYYNHNDAVLFGKALGNLNKVVYGGSVIREDIGTSSSTTTASVREAWRLHFGAFNDHNPFDISAGIPAEMETSLSLAIQYPSTSLLAATAAHKVLQTTTNVYAVVFGVSQLPPEYVANVPIPDFRTDIVGSPTSTTTVNLLGNRFLKRSTIIAQASATSNNNLRNDSNLTDFTIQLARPTTIKILDRVRWKTAKAILQAWTGRGPTTDADGSNAVLTTDGMLGVAVVDWRKITGNPFGLDLYKLPNIGDAQYIWTVGTTTGQISVLQEYYVGRSDFAIAGMKALDGRYPFQAV